MDFFVTPPPLRDVMRCDCDSCFCSEKTGNSGTNRHRRSREQREEKKRKKKDNRFNRRADADVFCHARVHFVNNRVMTSYRVLKEEEGRSQRRQREWARWRRKAEDGRN